MIVYVASRLREYNGVSIHSHICLAMEFCKQVLALGHTPFAPHVYFTRFLDDTIPAERDMGIKSGLEFLNKCDELWVFSPSMSPKDLSYGMKCEIIAAKDRNIPVIHQPDMYHAVTRGGEHGSKIHSQPVGAYHPAH